MLFSGDESLKSVNVLSGGEKVRCMLSRMMMKSANVLILDEPTAHLDLESITSLNNGLAEYKEVMIISSHDHEIVNTVANRIIEFTPSGIIDKQMQFDDYLNSDTVKAARDEAYGGQHLRLTI
jgi:ATPase subunit of ABC transporter with duplicated ATPase domains